MDKIEVAIQNGSNANRDSGCGKVDSDGVGAFPYLGSFFGIIEEVINNNYGHREGGYQYDIEPGFSETRSGTINLFNRICRRYCRWLGFKQFEWIYLA